MGPTGFRNFPADTAGSQPNHVLYHRSKYHPGIPVLWPGEDSDPGRTGGIHKPDCVFHLQGCVFNYRFGSAAAQSVILFAIIMVMTLMMFKAEKKGVSY